MPVNIAEIPHVRPNLGRSRVDIRLVQHRENRLSALQIPSDPSSPPGAKTRVLTGQTTLLRREEKVTSLCSTGAARAVAARASVRMADLKSMIDLYGLRFGFAEDSSIEAFGTDQQ